MDDLQGSAQEGTALTPGPPSTRVRRSSSNTSLSSNQGKGGGANPCVNPRALAIGLVSFLNNVCFCGMSVLLPLYVADAKWGLDTDSGAAAQMAGLMFAAVGVCQALVMTSIFHSLKSHMGLLKTCIAGSILHGLGIMMIPAPSRYRTRSLTGMDLGVGMSLVLCAVVVCLWSWMSSRPRSRLCYGKI